MTDQPKTEGSNIMKKTIEGSMVHFTFEGQDDLWFDTEKVSADIFTHAARHGFMQRLGDAAAIPRTDSKGNVINVTEAMRRDAVKQLADHYASGTKEWSLRITSNATAKSDAAAIAVLAELAGISIEDATAKFMAKKSG